MIDSDGSRVITHSGVNFRERVATTQWDATD